MDVRELWLSSSGQDSTRATQLLFQRAVVEAAANTGSHILYITDDAARLRQALGSGRNGGIDPATDAAVLARIEVKYASTAGELRTILGSLQLAPQPFAAVLVDGLHVWLPAGSDPVDLARTLAYV